MTPDDFKKQAFVLIDAISSEIGAQPRGGGLWDDQREQFNELIFQALSDAFKQGRDLHVSMPEHRSTLEQRVSDLEWQRDKWEIVANEWCFAFDELKKKYEPSYISPSQVRKDLGAKLRSSATTSKVNEKPE